MDENEWIKSIAKKIQKKIEVVAKRNRDKIPYTTNNGEFDDLSESDIFWWTNGFWGGIMWQMYHATGDDIYCEIARYNERKLKRNLIDYRGIDHDNGFRWLLTAVADYRLTGSKEAFNLAIVAAGNLAGRLNPAGNYLRAWNDNGDGCNAGIAIIDCMMNLPLLYWAYEEINDPRFLHIATIHADMAQKKFVREDGSVNHIVVFNPLTGEVIRTDGGQGYKEGSSWTRGQSWALYGFILSYIHTKNKEYLDTAKKVANYFISNIPEDGFIPVDFRQPRDCVWEDSSAAAIAACGMLEIEKYMEENEKHIYHNAALKLLMALSTYRCNWNENTDNIVEKCTVTYHDKSHENSLIYGDYYFIEAIWKLTGQESFMW